MPIEVIEHPVIQADLSILREKNTPNDMFRLKMARISEIMAIDILKHAELEEFPIETPLEPTTGFRLKQNYVLVPILRAGLGMLESFLKYLPEAIVSHIGVFRDEQTHKPNYYYSNIPSDLKAMHCLVLDPMLATGGSAAFAINCLKEKGASQLTLVSVVAAPEGITYVEQTHPEVQIYSATVDRELNATKYIMPGLGDAGDRLFGT